MGSVLAVFSEANRTFYPIAGVQPIDIEERRRIRGTAMRYCISGARVFLPAERQDLPPLAQLCWTKIRSEVAFDFPFEFEIGKQLPDYCTLDYLENEGVFIGDRYIKRYREVDGQLVPVDVFCAQTLIDTIADDREAIACATKTEFEELCAEIFARKGFKVDLLRTNKDGGIDFIAVDDNSADALVFAVQCKHPDIPSDGGRPKTLGRPVVQQIYGAAKGNNLHGAIAITSATFSPEAKAFADLKPDEIKVYQGKDVIEWITKYRWNRDEQP